MKRDMDCIRRILLTIEEYEHGFAPEEIKIDNYSDVQIGYHILLMNDAGLLNGYECTNINDKTPKASAIRMTWEGHEFLDNAKNLGIWKQAKEVVDKLGGASFSIWTSVLAKLVAQNLGV